MVTPIQSMIIVRSCTNRLQIMLEKSQFFLELDLYLYVLILFLELPQVLYSYVLNTSLSQILSFDQLHSFVSAFT